jgi:hypothetical protein
MYAHAHMCVCIFIVYLYASVCTCMFMCMCIFASVSLKKAVHAGVRVSVCNNVHGLCSVCVCVCDYTKALHHAGLYPVLSANLLFYSIPMLFIMHMWSICTRFTVAVKQAK